MSAEDEETPDAREYLTSQTPMGAAAIHFAGRIVPPDSSSSWPDRVAYAQLVATLALVEEQRTANLLAIIGKTHPNGSGAFPPPVVEAAVTEVLARVGVTR